MSKAYKHIMGKYLWLFFHNDQHYWFSFSSTIPSSVFPLLVLFHFSSEANGPWKDTLVYWLNFFLPLLVVYVCSSLFCKSIKGNWKIIDSLLPLLHFLLSTYIFMLNAMMIIIDNIKGIIMSFLGCIEDKIA